MILVRSLPSPLGDLLAGSVGEELCFLDFADSPGLQTALAGVALRLDQKTALGNSESLDKLQIQLAEYFAGERQVFDLKLRPCGTDFQLKVWQTLRGIPYGQTWSYKKEAQRMGAPQAIRAAARANGQNPLVILIPCHRVIGSDGRLAGYSGGLKRQQFLLTLEQKQATPPVS